MATKSVRKVVRVSHFTFTTCLRVMMRGPCKARQIADESGLHMRTIYELMRAMRKGPPELRTAHISGWAEDALGRPSIAVFTLGAGDDKARRLA